MSLQGHSYFIGWLPNHMGYTYTDIWGLWHQKQVSQAGISNCIQQYSVGCNYLSLPEIPASGDRVLILITSHKACTWLCFATLRCNFLNFQWLIQLIYLLIFIMVASLTLCLVYLWHDGLNASEVTMNNVSITDEKVKLPGTKPQQYTVYCMDDSWHMLYACKSHRTLFLPQTFNPWKA